MYISDDTFPTQPPQPACTRARPQVEPNTSCAVFGLGAVGLAVIQACKVAGATEIIAVDTNASKEEAARAAGATHFLNPMDVEVEVSHHRCLCCVSKSSDLCIYVLLESSHTTEA